MKKWILYEQGIEGVSSPGGNERLVNQPKISESTVKDERRA